MKQSSKRFTSTIIALMFFIVALIVFIEIIRPEYSSLEDMKGTEISTQQLLSQKKQLSDQAKDLINNYKNDKTTVQLLSLAMPSGTDMSGALAQIYGVASNDNLNVQSIQISVPPVRVASGAGAQKPPGILEFSISANGSYENMKQFLSDMEANLRIFDLKTMDLSAASVPISKNSGGFDFFSYDFKFDTYYISQ